MHSSLVGFDTSCPISLTRPRESQLQAEDQPPRTVIAWRFVGHMSKHPLPADQTLNQKTIRLLNLSMPTPSWHRNCLGSSPNHQDTRSSRSLQHPKSIPLHQ